MKAQSRAPKLAREGRKQFTGMLPNALPAYYLSKAPDGGLFVMWDRSTTEATGAQTCLAHIPHTVLEELLVAREPQGLRL